jgi:exodeoxyribonuclease V alpha subunit
MRISKMIQNLGLNHDLLTQGIELLKKPRKVTRKGRTVELGPQIAVDSGRISLRETYNAEVNIARHVRRLMSASLTPLSVPEGVFDPGFTPHPLQLEAIQTVATSAVVVLTGGPGTGKTTIVKGGLRVYRGSGLKVLQCAPTGKAAIRMNEQTEFPAATIHRSLGYQDGSWHHNETNPFEAEAVIADETSMVDVRLMDALLAGVKTGARLLLVGDVDQLPSIGAGRVLHDLILSGELPVVRLTKIFRQAEESRIPYVARDINEGRLPDNLAGSGTDVRFVEQADPSKAAEWIVHYATKVIPEAKGIPATAVQVLAGQKSKETGVEALNIALQQALNPAADSELDVFIGGGYSARTSDRVIHTQNNYDLEVMNGEMGTVVDADPKGVNMDDHPTARTSEDGDPTEDDASDYDALDYDAGYFDAFAPPEETEKKRELKKKYVLVIEFNGGSRQVAYNKTEARELLLGYAITIHKSQGSQFPAVVMACHSQHRTMLSRQLVYTGITRAESFVLMVGEEQALAKAARNTRGSERRTQLQTFLKQAVTEIAASESSLAGLETE